MKIKKRHTYEAPWVWVVEDIYDEGLMDQSIAVAEDSEAIIPTEDDWAAKEHDFDPIVNDGTSWSWEWE